MPLNDDYQRAMDIEALNERRPSACSHEIVLVPGERLNPVWDARLYISRDHSKIWIVEGSHYRVSLSRKEALGLLQALQNELVLDVLADLEDPS